MYRRSGADLPFGDPLPTHGTEMEGWFWRLSDAASGRVAIALCSANRHPDGDWSTAAIAVSSPSSRMARATRSAVTSVALPFLLPCDTVTVHVLSPAEVTVTLTGA